MSSGFGGLLGSRNVSEAPGGDFTLAGAGTMTPTLGSGRQSYLRQRGATAEKKVL